MTIEGWVLPKQESSWAPPGTCTILAVGLTWREAIFAIVFGSTVMAVPMTANGWTGARTRAPFPVLARASFGYHFAKFPVVIRLVTCLFWHAITNFLAIGPATQVIRSIWPSYQNLPNHIPESVGITPQQMASYFVIWCVQFPIMMIPPHKMRWLFVVKVFATTATILGTSTVRVNISDFTRYMAKPSWVAIVGIVVTSASGVLYGKLLWDPISIIDKWEGPGGRAAAFLAGVSWCIAQICINISPTVISGANDMASLFPKFIKIRRGAIILTILGGWVMVPWKILNSAGSLLSFMSSLGIFLAPIMGIQIADYYIVKRGHTDIPALYQPHGRYQYTYGINWRAPVALVLSATPQLPGLINAVNPSISKLIIEYKLVLRVCLFTICVTMGRKMHSMHDQGSLCPSKV
ncbi:putative uracil permease [Apodospora peruviana]|uniref:Uracil permease n=1 Tax=Apodospora peruviana TaxID=516989 RepID=A0AAE0IHD8_9PEZI|nr:putative uracil permease [Apodospora peruviana]